MKLSDLPDIEFVSADEQEILSDIIKLYTEITGRTLAQGDPVRLFLCVIAAIILMLCNKINYTGKQNLLRYSAGANLDHLGVLVGAERIGAKASVTTIKITLSDVRSVATNIPAGTRATAGDNVFFAIDQDATVIAGQLDVSVAATCTVAGMAICREKSIRLLIQFRTSLEWSIPQRRREVQMSRVTILCVRLFARLRRDFR